MRPFLHLVLAMAPALFAAATAAQAQEDPTLYVASYIDVVPASASQTATALKQLAEASRKDAGVISFEVLQRISPANQFVILAIWKDQQALDAHLAAAHSKQSTAQLASLLIAPVDTRVSNPLANGARQAVPAGALYAVSHVDVAPPKRDEGAAALKALAETSRKAPGNLRYDAVREKGRLNHFTVVEVWKDQESVDAQEIASHAREFRAQLATMTGALYDRRWYKAL
jgi:quinol monooxygenase YgiN